MPAPLYARYVPPKKHEPKPLASPQGQEKLEASRHGPTKRKRDTVQDSETENNEQDSKKHKSVLSKFERASKLAEAARAGTAAAQEQQSPPAPKLHDLVPLPPPEPIPDAPFEPTFSALPPWLAQPLTIPSSDRTSFRDLNLPRHLVELLEKKGFRDALAVQSALLQMLRPGLQQHLGDICVSAATGSGKTLAYLLPMVEGLQGRVLTKLCGLVVVPTRELVEQVLIVAQELCVGTKIRIGTAVGNMPYASERDLLVKRGIRYDPKAAEALHKKAKEQLRTGFVQKGNELGDLMGMPPGHVPWYESRVDLLICTPGRLVEHLQSTAGFHLQDVRWLVVDEVDRLLDQSFQEWVRVLTEALELATAEERMSPRESLSVARKWTKRRELTKVLLSATMTKDINKLALLGFSRPRLVLVENDEKPFDAHESTTLLGETFELPSTLEEWAVPVGDGSDKPLHLSRLLQAHVLQSSEPSRMAASPQDHHVEKCSDKSIMLAANAALSASEESLGAAQSNRSGSEEPSGTSSDELSSSESNEDKVQRKSNGLARHASIPKRVLIFTNNNENASRLSYLLSALHPPSKNLIGTLTKASGTKESKKVLAAFAQGRLRVLVASDRASRGLDLPNVSHVINYDIPRSVSGYVHRVGRTARAGRGGQAWTLYTKTEARWFWNEIAKGHAVGRGTRKVERVTLSTEDAITSEDREKYQAALGELRSAVEGGTRPLAEFRRGAPSPA